MRCTWTRWRLSRALDEGAAPAATGHLARCPRCQQHRRRLAALDTQLRASVARAPAPIRPTGRPVLVRRVAGLALVAATAVVLVVSFPDSDSPAPVAPAATAAAPPAVPHEAPGGLVTRLSARLRAGADQLVGEPSRAELATLRRDARRGLGYVLRVSGLDVVGDSAL